MLKKQGNFVSAIDVVQNTKQSTLLVNYSFVISMHAY